MPNKNSMAHAPERKEDMSSYLEGQGHQLLNALEKAGFTSEHLTKLGQYRDLEGLKNLLNGYAELKIIQHVIDCDTDPTIPYDGWKVEEHKKGGMVVWDPTKVALYLSPNQKNGKSIQGYDLRKELASRPSYNANALDYLLKNPHLIPEEWKVDESGKTRFIFFWGTIYRDSDGSLDLRYLYWFDGRWQTGCDGLGGGWGVQYPSAESEILFISLLGITGSGTLYF